MITTLGLLVFTAEPAILAPGFNNDLYWTPTSLRSYTPEDLACETFVQGVVLGLHLLHCLTAPRGLSPISIIYLLTGDVHAITKPIADRWLPGFTDAIEAHRSGNPTKYGELLQTWMSMSVSSNYRSLASFVTSTALAQFKRNNKADYSLISIWATPTSSQGACRASHWGSAASSRFLYCSQSF